MSLNDTGAPPQVLAIDDERDILDIVKTCLESEGFQVHTASGPREGLDFYEKNWRDIRLVLLDYLMPEMTGDLVFESLKQINPDVRVLLLTACEDHVAHRMFANGLRGYLQKPFFLEDLIERVRGETEAS